MVYEDSPTSTYITVLVTPDMVNFDGVMHGGDLLKKLDQAAYICATRYCKKRVVTLSVDRVLFRTPIPIGSVLHFYASINYTGNTSCEVGIKVICEDITTGSMAHCNSTYVTMVATVDRKPSAIPPFTPKTDDEKRRYADAKARRASRMGDKK